MRPEEVFKRYDIRGDYPEEIDEEFAEILGRAFGTFVIREEVEKVVVTRDTKVSSEKLKEYLEKGLAKTGVKVLDAGVGPTDYAAIVGRENSAFSVQVTSSHLSMGTNGFKFMYPEGNSLVNDDLNLLQKLFMERDLAEGEGSVEDVKNESKDLYEGEARKFLSDRGLRPVKNVYLETMSGAGAVFLPDILENYDVDIKHSDGRFDPPDPDSHDFGDLKSSVDSGKTDIGIVTDMDADRARIYHGNEWIDGNTVIYVLSKALGLERIVASVDTSQRLEEHFDGDLSYTRVGDPFVLDEMLERDAQFSGEPNNHFAFSQFVPYNSATIAALVLASVDIGTVREELPERKELRESIEVEDKEKVMEEAEGYAREQGEIISEVDGVKFAMNDTDVLVRKSGTSEKIRLVVDAPDLDEAERVLEQVKTTIIND